MKRTGQQASQRKKRQIVKQKITAIADKAVHDAFEEAAHMAASEGAARSSLDFCRWFVAAFSERLSGYPNFKR